MPVKYQVGDVVMVSSIVVPDYREACKVLAVTENFEALKLRTVKWHFPFGFTTFWMDNNSFYIKGKVC